jgi:hypothetical protein
MTMKNQPQTPAVFKSQFSDVHSKYTAPFIDLLMNVPAKHRAEVLGDLEALSSADFE